MCMRVREPCLERLCLLQVLFLSKNSLRSTQGLEQFPHARVLSLADNLLGDWGDVSRLASCCPALEALSMEGNPLSSMPSYRYDQHSSRLLGLGRCWAIFYASLTHYTGHTRNPCMHA